MNKVLNDWRDAIEKLGAVRHWDICLKISDHGPVDEAIRAFAEDQTQDNAVCMVRAIVETTVVFAKEQQEPSPPPRRFSVVLEEFLRARFATLQKPGPSEAERNYFLLGEELNEIIRKTNEHPL